MFADFVSVLLLLGLGQCVFLMGILATTTQRFRTANVLLFILLFAFTWYQLEFLLLRETLDTEIPFLYSTRYGSWLLVGPVVLLYNRAILRPAYRLRYRDAWHFLPFLFFTLLLPPLIGEVVTDRATHYGMLTVFDEFNREVITWRHYLYGFVFVAQFLHAAAYLYVAHRETRSVASGPMPGRPASLTGNRIATLKYIYLTSLTILLLCTVFVAYLFLTTMWKRNLDYLYVLPMLVLVFGLAYRAMKYPNSSFILTDEAPSTGPKYARSGLHERDKRRYLEELDKLFAVDRIYRNNELRLSDLAKSLGISNHHLSQLLNEEKKQNFFDFVNGYRVAEARERMVKPGGETLLQIAFAVGFNSKNAFNNAFKRQSGMTPSAYRKTKNEDKDGKKPD